jgi:hypothetical protein
LGAAIEVITGDPIEIGISAGPTDAGTSVVFADAPRIITEHRCSGAGAIATLVVDGTGIAVITSTSHGGIITIASRVTGAIGIVALRTWRGIADFLRAGIAGAIIALII